MGYKAALIPEHVMADGDLSEVLKTRGEGYKRLGQARMLVKDNNGGQMEVVGSLKSGTVRRMTGTMRVTQQASRGEAVIVTEAHLLQA